MGLMIEAMRRAISPDLRDKILHHPFNRELAQGTLPIAKFKQFLIQDRLYLQDFTRALLHTSKRLHAPQHRQLFAHLAEEVMSTEAELLYEYFPQYRKNRFRFAPELKLKKTPVINDYTLFLLTNSQHEPVEVAIASLVPCYDLWSQFSSKNGNHYYQSWIKSYSNPDFLTSTQAIIQTVNELSQGIPEHQQKQMVDAYVRATVYELGFLDWSYGCSSTLDKVEIAKQTLQLRHDEEQNEEVTLRR